MTRPAEQITLGEIISLVDGPLELLAPGPSQPLCLTASFSELEDLIRNWMEKSTLADLLLKDFHVDNMNFEI